jgi:hypothetical protein
MYDDARCLFEQALSVDSGNDKAANNLGVLSFELGNYDTAKDFFVRAIELNPDNRQARANLDQSIDEAVGAAASEAMEEGLEEPTPQATRGSEGGTNETPSVSAPVCPDPIFVVGSPRSGTSQLAHSLARHSQNWISRESHFFNDLRKAAEKLHLVGTKWCEISYTWWLAKEGVTVDELLKFIGYGMNALFTERSGGLRWIDHTPGYALNLRDLGVAFPGARFIHTVRDGRDVVNSMIHSEHHRGVGCDWAADFQSACKTWAEHVEAAFEYEAANPHRVLRACFESISTGSSEDFKTICDFLELPYEEATTGLFKKGKRLNSSFNEAERVRLSWQNSWSHEQRAEFASICGPLLIRLGYETDDSWVDSVQPAVSGQEP